MLNYAISAALILGTCVPSFFLAAYDPSWPASQENKKETPSEENWADTSSSPRSNPRWVKERSSRQEYLKGGNNYPKTDTKKAEVPPETTRNERDSSVPSSNPRWTKDPALRSRYLQGGSDYPHTAL